jgi:hypothetical protein
MDLLRHQQALRYGRAREVYMIEHDHWRGPDYRKMGVGGQKLAIVGYSHYLQPGGTDSTDFTVRTMTDNVLARCCVPGFFDRIASYFDMDSEFWNRVVFFNFVPCCIGFDDDKFKGATPDQVASGQARTLKILAAELPDKLFVFTARGWHEFPETNAPTLSLADRFSSFQQTKYNLAGKRIDAFGLRHPFGAVGRIMRDVVQHIRSMGS